MALLTQENRRRIGSAAGVAVLHALLGYAFLTGLGFRLEEAVRDDLKMFNVFVEPTPPAVPPEPEKVEETQVVKPKDPEGAAAPPNLKDTPTQIVVPKPKIKLPVPDPIVAAPAAGQGAAPAAGAAEIKGPGTGRGGQGTGLGSGLHGSGPGGGGGGLGRRARARWISGRIFDSDDPRSRRDRGVVETVYVRFIVAPTGRVSDCRVTRSSGNPALDRTTCRLILQRFRYRPARDAEGRPIAEPQEGPHVWDVRPEPPPIDVEPEEVDPDE